MGSTAAYLGAWGLRVHHGVRLVLAPAPRAVLELLHRPGLVLLVRHVLVRVRGIAVGVKDVLAALRHGGVRDQRELRALHKVEVERVADVRRVLHGLELLEDRRERRVQPQVLGATGVLVHVEVLDGELREVLLLDAPGEDGQTAAGPALVGVDGLEAEVVLASRR